MKSSRPFRSIFVCLVVFAACAGAPPVPQELRAVRQHCDRWAMNRCAGLWECVDVQRRRCVAAFGWTRAEGQWTRVRTSADLGREIDALVARRGLGESGLRESDEH